jgi:cytochrome c oxidase accessory protein FixG
VLGRVWCGYACPQTVWVDLYQHVERWIDGDRNAQFRLLKQRWNLEKIARRFSKWSIWLAIAVSTGGAWIFYFADAPTLFLSLFAGTAPLVAYATIGVLTGTTFILGGFLREQVCMYMCPWPRIQAAMLDENSLTVTYKDWRGEPRGKHRKKEGAEALGDCIDCNACVAVCPTGVDIRLGQQIGCITCALCIDACDDIMTKVGKPRGLIDYCTLADEPLERAGAAPAPVWRRVIRPRTILYTAMLSAIGIGMVVALFMRDSIGLTVAHDRNPMFVTLSDGTIRNAYSLKIQNMNSAPHAFRISAKSEHELRLDIQGTGATEVEIGADESGKLRIYLLARPWFDMQERMPVRIWVEDLVTRERAFYDTIFQGPER